MVNYIIPKKESNTGSIHDLSSDMHDREIVFPMGTKYAVVCAAYYGGKGYTTHCTEGAAIAQSRKWQDYSHKIIDVNGSEYVANGDRLYKKDC
jgi:hypothetical protein